MSYIVKQTDDIVPIMTVKVFVNQKAIRKALKANITVYKEDLLSGDISPYKAMSYNDACDKDYRQ